MDSKLLTVLEINNQREELCDEMPEFWKPHIDALCDTAASAPALRAEVEALRDALEAIIDHAQAHVNDYHAAMKGYREHQHASLDADMAKARAALAGAQQGESHEDV